MVDLEEVDEDRDIVYEVYQNDYREDLHIFVDKWVDEMYLKIYTIFKNNDEIAIADSILELFKMRNILDVFNKKAIYFYIREITGLNTKQVVNNLNRIRIRYKIFKSSWNDANI